MEGLTKDKSFLRLCYAIMAFTILWLASFCNQTTASCGLTVTITHSHFQKNIAKRKDYDEVISGGSLILPSPD